MIYRIINGLCPDNLKGRLATRSQISNYSTRSYLDLDIPRQNVYHVQKEIKGIPAKLAFPPEARSLERPALYLKLQFNVNFLFFVSQLADRVSV